MSGRSVEEISKEYANCGYGNFKNMLQVLHVVNLEKFKINIKTY